MPQITAGKRTPGEKSEEETRRLRNVVGSASRRSTRAESERAPGPKFNNGRSDRSHETTADTFRQALLKSRPKIIRPRRFPFFSPSRSLPRCSLAPAVSPLIIGNARGANCADRAASSSHFFARAALLVSAAHLRGPLTQASPLQQRIFCLCGLGAVGHS